MRNRQRRGAKRRREIARRWMQMIIGGSSFSSRVRDLSYLVAHKAVTQSPAGVLFNGSRVRFLH